MLDAAPWQPGVLPKMSKFHAMRLRLWGAQPQRSAPDDAHDANDQCARACQVGGAAQPMPDAGARHRRVLCSGRNANRRPTHAPPETSVSSDGSRSIWPTAAKTNRATGQIADKTNRRPVWGPLEALRTNMRRSAFRPRLVLQHSSIMTGHDACGVASIRAQRIPPYVATDSRRMTSERSTIQGPLHDHAGVASSENASAC